MPSPAASSPAAPSPAGGPAERRPLVTGARPIPEGGRPCRVPIPSGPYDAAVSTPPTALPISSARNPRIRAAAALRDRAAREETGLTIVDGGREVTRAVASGVGVHEAFVCDELLRSADAIEAARLVESTGAPIVRVTPEALERVAFGARSEGIVAVVRIPPTSLEALRLGPGPLVAVIEGVEKPGNVGAILRSADGAGADAVVAADPRTDLFNPNAIRASLGTIFAVGVASATTDETLRWLRRHGLRIVAARVDGGRLHTEADLTGPLAVVLGSEAHGLAAAWSGPDIEAVRLPMLGVADSLNVAAAAAILLYEARRQRGVP